MAAAALALLAHVRSGPLKEASAEATESEGVKFSLRAGMKSLPRTAQGGKVDGKTIFWFLKRVPNFDLVNGTVSNSFSNGTPSSRVRRGKTKSSKT